MDIWSPFLQGARFLDLFAGSGAVGIEAVSRGAVTAFLVESDPQVLTRLRENCRLLADEETSVVAARVPDELSQRLAGLTDPFDLIFADPPYVFEDFAGLLPVAAGLLAPAGIMAIEHDRRRDLETDSNEVTLIDRRRYGDTCLSFYRIATVDQD